MILSIGDAAPDFRAQPISGLPVRSGGRPLVIVFLRSLSGGLAWLAVQRLTEAYPRFDAAGIGVVAISRCDLTFARDFVPRHHVLFPIVVDDGRWAEAFGVGRDRGFVGTLTRPDHFETALRALTAPRGRPDGGVDTLPAAFVVGAEGRVRHAWYAASILELPDVEALWAAAG